MKETTNSLAIFDSMSDRSLIKLLFDLVDAPSTGFYKILKARCQRAAAKRGFTI